MPSPRSPRPGWVVSARRAALRRLLGSTAPIALGFAGFAVPAAAQDAALQGAATATGPDAARDVSPPAKPETTNEIVVTGALNALPIKDVGTIFGFNKTLAETPRSASTVSSQQLERFGITQIYDLVSQVPGTFSSSYFGTGGALEIRGTPGEVYFRGVLRLENGGNYPTPIGAADRIDIVRGPASPIYGPSKTGGYINFVPKTARAENGTYADHATGFMSYQNSSFGGNVGRAGITGPVDIAGHKVGYSLYGEIEDSNSYYRYVTTRNTLLSAAFDTDITDNLRTEFGGLYQHYKGQQNSGWNRLTQNLIDNGTYITGNAGTNLSNAQGLITRQAAYNANGGNGLTTFGSFPCINVNGGFNPAAISVGPLGYTNACFNSNLKDDALINPGTAQLSKRDTLTGPNDKLYNTQTTGYFDLIWKGASDLEIKNQLFFDRTNNLNENLYGFSQKIKSYVVEDKLVLADSFTTAPAKISIQASPSLRLTHFHFGDDFGAEFWNRPDLTTGYTAASSRLLSTVCNCMYSDYVVGHYLDAGAAGLIDADFNFGLDVIGGVRYDHVHANSNALQGMYDPASYSNNEDANGNFIPHATGNKGAVSWNTSVSYKTPIGLLPYFTASRQTTIVEGEGGELEPGPVSTNSFMAASTLIEAGIKGSFLDKRLFAAVALYKQHRTDAAAESSLTNQVVKTKGVEFEMRWSVDKHLLVSANYTYIQVIDLSALAGGFFNYFGAGDLVNTTNPALEFGGSQVGLIFPSSQKYAERPGIPQNVVSGTATYAFDNGFAVNGDFSAVDHTYSGYTQHVRLPAFFLLNVGGSYSTRNWLFRAIVKNATNARYFRAGGQDLFGADIALPQLPRNYQATIEYKF